MIAEAEVEAVVGVEIETEDTHTDPLVGVKPGAGVEVAKEREEKEEKEARVATEKGEKEAGVATKKGETEARAVTKKEETEARVATRSNVLHRALFPKGRCM